MSKRGFSDYSSMLVDVPMARRGVVTRSFIKRPKAKRGFYYRRAPPASRGFWGPQRRSPQELKLKDVATADYICDTTGSVTLMNGVANGSDFTDRIGRKVNFRTIQVEGLIHPVGTITSATGALCRVMLVYDSQPNGALPTVADVLTGSTANAFMNLNNRDRFRVLMDKQVAMDQYDNDATTAIPTRNYKVVFYKKIDCSTIYDGTTNAIGDIQSGSIFLLTVGSTADDYTFSGAVRLRFVDA